ncbi:hypothetical protein P691DRAFT_465638 [Macrolepiota fuliginosa MF-IS2]|uniref:Wax synthase domain-containing protein n=1 Tax=Macrolepiota fuliginosa MF-IS2 TaxID=1400762 RepID=A0A9P5XFH7_9AGAR|nr:hypothetical protein P691DRAFT_465638 [Macrolepiota fuliginosa MF-IS2]
MLRRVLLTTTNLIIHTILHLPRTSEKSSPGIKIILGPLKLHTVFLVSALTHAAGESLGHGGSGASSIFFRPLPWAITLEMAIQYLVTGSTRPSDKTPTLIRRMLGYVTWVVSWFILVAPFMQQPIIEAGIFPTMPRSALTQKVTKLLALNVI